MYTQKAINKGMHLTIIFINERTEIQTTIESKPRPRKNVQEKMTLYFTHKSSLRSRVRESFGQPQDEIQTFDRNWKVTEHWHSGYSLYACSEANV